jgi:hypothetical protein
VNPEKKYPILARLLSPYSKRHRKTLGLVAAAITATGVARSFAVATTMMTWLGVRLASAVQRFYRLLKNARIDYTELVATLADAVCRNPQRHLIIPVDWTEWHHGLRLLVASVVVGKRGVPLFTQAFAQRIWRRSQNTRENTFLRVLADALRRAGVNATILCDRGFRRVSWIQLLQNLRLGFVVRLMSDVYVEVAPGLKLALDDVLLPQGHVVDLGLVPLRADGAATVRIIGYWAPGAHEPWWLATSETCDARRVLRLYDRRMTVEELFRDSKGCRFGSKLFWTQFRDPEALAHFLALLGVALLIWILTGIAAARRDPSLRLRSRKKGPRQSYVTIGVRIIASGGSHPPWTSAALGRWLEPPALRQVAGVAVGGK